VNHQLSPQAASYLRLPHGDLDPGEVVGEELPKPPDARGGWANEETPRRWWYRLAGFSNPFVAKRYAQNLKKLVGFSYVFSRFLWVNIYRKKQ